MTEIITIQVETEQVQADEAQKAAKQAKIQAKYNSRIAKLQAQLTRLTSKADKLNNEDYSRKLGNFSNHLEHLLTLTVDADAQMKLANAEGFFKDLSKEAQGLQQTEAQTQQQATQERKDKAAARKAEKLAQKAQKEAQKLEKLAQQVQQAEQFIAQAKNTLAGSGKPQTDANGNLIIEVDLPDLHLNLLNSIADQLDFDLDLNPIPVKISLTARTLSALNLLAKEGYLTGDAQGGWMFTDKGLGLFQTNWDEVRTNWQAKLSE